MKRSPAYYKSVKQKITSAMNKPAVLVIVLVCAFFVFWLIPDKEEVFVDEVLDVQLASALPCQMIYGFEAPTSGGDVDISVQVGPAADADDAVEAVRENRRRLKDMADEHRDELMVQFALDWAGKIHVKHRGIKHLYERDGWYLLMLDDDGTVWGEYFLSDTGTLMPAIRTCSRIECCI